MAELIMPKTGPRIAPLPPDRVSPYVRSEYDKTVATWGIPNNLIRTMACLPQLALTEVDYANSFIFDEGTYITWPRPGAKDPTATVLFPAAGFVDRVTKELVINLVSLLNRSRYSITHHTLIGFSTLSARIAGSTPSARASRAEAMLLHLVNGEGRLDIEGQTYDGRPLYDEYELAALNLATKLRNDAHAVTDEEMHNIRRLATERARLQIAAGPLAAQFGDAGPDAAYLDAYVDGMVVELTWCIVHFSGLLNAWFTVLKVRDEENAQLDGIDFVEAYNTTVPDTIKVRNNLLLGRDGWGNNLNPRAGD